MNLWRILFGGTSHASPAPDPARRGHRLGRCAECHWWAVQIESERYTAGQCRRMAPVTNHTGKTLWPMTKADEACGQYKDRVASHPITRQSPQHHERTPHA